VDVVLADTTGDGMMDVLQVRVCDSINRRSILLIDWRWDDVLQVCV
jgi:hypothetical protein